MRRKPTRWKKVTGNLLAWRLAILAAERRYTFRCDVALGDEQQTGLEADGVAPTALDLRSDSVPRANARGYRNSAAPRLWKEAPAARHFLHSKCPNSRPNSSTRGYYCFAAPRLLKPNGQTPDAG